MKKTLKKLFNMEDKDNNAPEHETAEATAETLEQQPETAEGEYVSAKIQELQKQLEEARGKYLYLFSDFENFKRHAARERMDLIQTAGRDILTAMLPVLDDFDRAEKSDALPEGAKLIQQKFAHLLQSRGLKIMDTKPGDAFDADRHEAVAEIPAATEELRGKIIDILEPGYTLGERIIRFAKVVVGR
jgi:molecular chaperone GrpE